MLTPAAFEPRGKRPPKAGSARLRFWSIRHARALERLYAGFEPMLVKLAPLARRIGWQRLEGPVAVVEQGVKSALFDCRMCGQCVLSSTGMSCPMNCPKNLRNGPCGGVRANGHCEVYPDMPCVWVQAWEGSLAMTDGQRIREVQPPVDHRQKGTSSWLRVMREKCPDTAEAAR
ncbi:methylenetetrahydrofolate reductase C-terminal domain-containing protein [Alsobacter sp. R-9]